MDITQKIHLKLEKILLRLKVLKIIQTFKLEINFCKIEKNLVTSLVEIDSILKKCLKKIIAKPKKAEIRNVITELVRKKNLNDGIVKRKNEFEEEKSFIYNRDFDECSRSRDEILESNETHITRDYLCEFCGETFHSTFKWKSHKNGHRKDCWFKCEKCVKSFSSLKKFRIHNKTHKESFSGSLRNILPSTNELKTCDPSTSLDSSVETNKSSLGGIALENQKTEAENKNYVCQCGKIFRLLKTLKKHKSVKHSARKEVHSCTICEKHFLEKGKLNRHMLSHKCAQYQCTSCLRKFARSDALKRHFSVAHSQQKNFSCRFCQKKFNLKYNKDVHEENIHKNVNNWIQCDVCGQKFRNKITLKGHLKIHSENRINCGICGKTFIRKICYRNHIKNQHLNVGN